MSCRDGNSLHQSENYFRGKTFFPKWKNVWIFRGMLFSTGRVFVNFPKKLQTRRVRETNHISDVGSSPERSDLSLGQLCVVCVCAPGQRRSDPGGAHRRSYTCPTDFQLTASAGVVSDTSPLIAAISYFFSAPACSCKFCLFAWWFMRPTRNQDWFPTSVRRVDWFVNLDTVHLRQILWGVSVWKVTGFASVDKTQFASLHMIGAWT